MQTTIPKLRPGLENYLPKKRPEKKKNVILERIS